MGFSRREYWSGLPFPSPKGKSRNLRTTRVSLALSVAPSQHAYITALIFSPPCSQTSRPPEISLLRHRLLSQAPQSLPHPPRGGLSRVGPKAGGRAWKGWSCLHSWLQVGAPAVGGATGSMSQLVCIFPALHCFSWVLTPKDRLSRAPCPLGSGHGQPAGDTLEGKEDSCPFSTCSLLCPGCSSHGQPVPCMALPPQTPCSPPLLHQPQGRQHLPSSCSLVLPSRRKFLSFSLKPPSPIQSKPVFPAGAVPHRNLWTRALKTTSSRDACLILGARRRAEA